MFPNGHLLIGAPELNAVLESADRPVLLDVRSAAAFANGHLPHAAHLDPWGMSLVDSDPAPLGAFLWIIEHLLGLRGVSAARPVVVYGDVSDLRAARVFWFLEYFGCTSVRVLDGGFAAWSAAGLPVTTMAEEPVDSEWHAAPRRELLATWQDVQASLGRPEVVLLDTRTDEEYLGTVARSNRAGAIPGAVHVEWVHNLPPDGHFKPAAELRRLYEQAGVTPDRPVIAYCQGGYRAAHGYLALRLLGYPRLRNYLASYREWGNRTDVPVEIPGRPVVTK
jgi:thiosulfate/3-mercaptopyruvate sulfurtransferase